jgi:hypothetical protein
VLEDTEVVIDPTCAVVVTMNPGYLGRSELPGETASCSLYRLFLVVLSAAPAAASSRNIGDISLPWRFYRSATRAAAPALRAHAQPPQYGNDSPC